VEAKLVVLAVEHAETSGLEGYALESNTQGLVHELNNGNVSRDAFAILYMDVKTTMAVSKMTKLNWVIRGANKLTHRMAQ